jgi:shikimate 5-dehydrogenase
MKACKKKGATSIDGSQMLYQQAEKAWEIWQSK